MTPNYLGPARLCQSARSTKDIRDQHRESLETQRHQNKFVRMLKKRGLVVTSAWDWDSDQDLTENLLEKDDLFNSEYEVSEMSESYDEVDFASTESWDPSGWFSDINRRPRRPCNTPSPSLSIGSESSHNSLTGSPLPHQRRNKLPRSRHESLLIRKRLSETRKDDESVRHQFEELKAFIISNSSKPELLVPMLTSRWKTISDAILHQDNELVHNALVLTNDLVSSDWIRTEDLLFILQQGFLLTLKEALVRSGNHQVDVIKLILAIIRHGPSATPYIIQLLSTCGLLETFSELFLMGSSEDRQMVTQFYSEVFHILCGLAAINEFCPIVPPSIAATNSVHKLSKLYDPMQTLKQIVQPTLTAPIVNWLFKQIGFIDCETFRSSLTLVANFARYVTFYLQNISSDTEWARSMGETFECSHIESLITGSIQNGSIDQYPGSVKVELEQFREFYRCWSDEISHYVTIC